MADFCPQCGRVGTCYTGCVEDLPKDIGFQSLPRTDKWEGRCGAIYYEFDGREGRVKCRCSRKADHWGDHGWSP